MRQQDDASIDNGQSQQSQQSQQRYVPGSSTFANHAMGWQNSSQNLYSSQTSIGLALSQSDRLRMMSEMASQNNGNSMMSQDSVQYPYEDYKSQDVSSMMSQDFDIRSQASQSFTQF
jgi:regulator of nonsense transcripts 1